MGIESYGLIGFFVSLQSLLAILDMGLGTTLNREMARFIEETERQNARDLMRTLEIIYWIVAVLIAALMAALASFVANSWIKSTNLSTDTIYQAATIAGLVIAARWPVNAYSGALLGLQKQALVNLVNCVCATLQGVGAVAILWFVSPTIGAFLLWQLAVEIIRTGTFARILWLNLRGGSEGPSFKVQRLAEVWRFSAGMFGIALLSIILAQSDKILLSKFLPLELFGYYTLASTVAGAFLSIVAPIRVAVFPRFSQLVHADITAKIISLYHRSSQLVSVVLIPAAGILAMFSQMVLQIWTGDATAARIASPILVLLVIGHAINGLLHIPYSVQLAYGWTSLALHMNVASVILFIPMLAILSSKYGALGAAGAWAGFNAVY